MKRFCKVFSFIMLAAAAVSTPAPGQSIKDRIKRKAEDVFRLLVHEAAAAGYGEYRTHLSFMDDIAKTYGWNDDALLKLHQTIKDALDPNGILAPGKSGIWPARYRRSHS